MLNVISVFTAHPGQRDALLGIFRENMPRVHAEPGCVSYQPFIDAPQMGPMHVKLGEDTFIVLESWASEEALRTHSQVPHIAEFLQKTQPMIAALIVNILTPA